MNALNANQVAALLGAAEPPAPVFLVGAGGCGMSGLAHLLLDLGHRVYGSDLVLNEEVRQLQARGAELQVGHAGSHIDDAHPVLVVYSSAVRLDNPELEAAQLRQIPIVRRAVLLSALLLRQRGICVAGMHGKTTTSALLALALENLGANPSYAVGALVPQLKRHARFNAAGSAHDEPPFFVIEADESDGSLREFRPAHSIVLNLDEEHLDYFANLAAICQEFQNFAAATSGLLMFCADDARLADLFARHPRAVSYGFHPLAAYRIAGLEQTSTGSRFEVWRGGKKLGDFSIQLLGEKNASNAAAVIALLHQLGFAPARIQTAIAGFRGAARRQQELFRDHRFRVFDDYGHHPSEISATLRAFKELGARRLLVAFQPHRFTRTQFLLPQFAACFRQADRLWLAEIYSANEPEIPGISSDLLADAIRAQGQSVELVSFLGAGSSSSSSSCSSSSSSSCSSSSSIQPPQFEDEDEHEDEHEGRGRGRAKAPPLVESVRAAMQPGDLVLFLGAGDITKAAHLLADQLREERPALTEAAHAELAANLSTQSVLRRDEPLAKRTTLRVGGRADLYVEPASEADLQKVLQWCHDRQTPFYILGRGSNLLIKDGGLRGVVIALAHPRFSRIDIADDRLQVGAGAKLKAVAVAARRHLLSGLEFVEGIPGSVGGALRMNAGAMGSWMFDVVESIRFMDYHGQVQERRASEVNVEYRGCPLFKNHIALSAVLKGQPAPKEFIEERMSEFSRKRWDTQPAAPSAGCIFKNPKTISAGRLIDELGLKGTRVGRAVVSTVHGNFIVNEGGATAVEVLQLIETIKRKAKEARGIDLETEVEIVGE